MAVPYLAGALKGWTTKTSVTTIVQTVVNHQTVETETATTLDINRQPMPAAKVNKKPEEERTWKWWSFIVKQGPLLKSNDKIVIDSITYRIMSANNWSESGFTKYEAIEDYQ
jgi:hypothetical protein